MDFTPNQLTLPFGLFFAASMFVLFRLHQAALARQRAQLAERLTKLSPPAKERNHRSLPIRQYFLTQQLAPPTPDDELALKQYSVLQRLQRERKARKAAETGS